jgi:hypothetical protein
VQLPQCPSQLNLDHPANAEITALAAAAIGHDYLCLLAQKNGAQARSIGTKLDEKQSGNAKT